MLAFWRRRKPSAPSEKDVRCSFCSKTRHDVRKLIAGPGVVICDECVEICNDILADEHRFASTERRDEPSTKPSADVAGFPVICRLCGMRILSGEALLIEERGTVCKPCVTAVLSGFETDRGAHE